MSLALFDLDNTLLAGDSDHAWGQFLAETGVVDGEAHRRENDRYYAQYQAGTLDIHEYLGFALQPLTRFDMPRLNAMHREFMQAHILPMITPKARALLDKHRARGDRLVIITSTNRFVTQPIAQALGVPDLLATEPEQRDGRYTGAVAGVPCFREGKVTRLKEWLARERESLVGSWGYSDSLNDLPLLELTENPVAVDPDDVLRRVAAERGWPIISLR